MVKPKFDNMKQWIGWGLIGSLGYAVVVPLVAGAFIGSLIDSALGTSPKVTLVLLLLGLAISVVSLYTIIKDLD